MKSATRLICLLSIILLLFGFPVDASQSGSAREIERDGRFIAYDNGTVKDTKTGLMWASKDNGKSINWKDAKRYCENYRGGGYTDWRMPTINELAGLLDKDGSGYAPECSGGNWKVHITKLIRITCCCLSASNTDGSTAAVFYFIDGVRWWHEQSSTDYGRALPVRGGN